LARFIVGHRWRALGEKHPRLEHWLYRLDHAFFSSLLWLIKRLPIDAASSSGGFLGRSLGPRFKKSRALEENLAIAFPEFDHHRRKTIAREAWDNAGRVFAEYVHLESIRDGKNPQRLEVIDHFGMEVVTASQKPVIFVAAHQANWELTAAAVTRFGIPLSVVYSPPTNPLIDTLMQHWRQHIRCELIPREESMRPLMRALNSGRSIGVIIDRRVDNGRDIALFNHEKPTSLIAARLAIRYQCPLVPVRVERLDGAYFRVTVCEPIAEPQTGGDELTQASLMISEVHRQFERWIRERPGQWFPSKRLWPKSLYPRKTHGAAGASPVV